VTPLTEMCGGTASRSVTRVPVASDLIGSGDGRAEKSVSACNVT
jgi:hypothetical protein